MKKIIALIMTLVMVLSFTTVAFAKDSHEVAAGKISAAELKIAKAYLKTTETFDVKYINAVLYPGADKFAMDSLPEGIVVKILNPKFSKTIDSELKLTRIDFSGLMVVSSNEELALTDLTKGIALKLKKKTPYAFQDVVVKAEDIAAISDLDEKVKTELTDYLTGLYGAETAQTLMDGYVVSEPENSDDAGTEGDGGEGR